MKRLIVPALVILALYGCNNGAPDVSNIKAPVVVKRFDSDFFSADSNNVAAALPALEKKYPTFLPVFVKYVLGATDSSGKQYDLIALKRFLHISGPVYAAAANLYQNIDPQQKELEQGFKFVKYYYPAYKVPQVITVVGPIDAMAKMENGDFSPNFLGPDFIAISLQFYLGPQFAVYQDQYFLDNVAPFYRSRRFKKEYITADVMKLVADDLHPDKSAGQSLVVQLVEKGKQWFLLDKLLPFAADSVKTGYTQAQLDWCKTNEGMAWNFILQSNDIYTSDPGIIQTFIGEAPKTDGMPDGSPGNIGQWIGWQIVKAYAQKNDALTLQQVLQTPAKKIFEEAKYKPK